jgi:glycosyltransferase involved in cell wall biosynthesis
MIIAHYYDGIYIDGGVRQYILSLARLQVSAGHQIILFEKAKTTARGDGLPTIVIKNNSELFETSRALRVDLLHFHASLTCSPPNDIAIVFTAHQHLPHCMSGGLYLKRRDLPCPRTHSLVGCLKGHLQDHCGSLRPLKVLANFKQTEIFMKVLPNVSVICVGRFLRDRMIRAGYQPERLFYIPNFTNFSDLAMPEPDIGTPHFLFLGRLEKLKGLSWLLRSFKLMSCYAILDVAGAGTYEAVLRKLVAELGLHQRVRFLGWTDDVEKSRLLRRARAIVVPSTWHEAFGLVVIEAAAQKCPAIVSDAGELPFIVDNDKTGIVVPTGDVFALAASLDLLAGNVQKARAMGAAARIKCRESYGPEAHIAAVSKIYRKTILNRNERLNNVKAY